MVAVPPVSGTEAPEPPGNWIATGIAVPGPVNDVVGANVTMTFDASDALIVSVAGAPTPRQTIPLAQVIFVAGSRTMLPPVALATTVAKSISSNAVSVVGA